MSNNKENKLMVLCAIAESVLILTIVSILLDAVNFGRVLPYMVPYAFSPVVRTRTIISSPIMYGVNVDMSQLLPTSEHYVVNSKGEDLIDLAARLGVNMFRITNSIYSFEHRKPTFTKDEWNTVLNKMQSKGIRALILIESPTLYQKYITEAYLPFVQSYIIGSGVLDHQDVYGVDLYNEPVINSVTNVSLLRRACDMIKTKYPHVRLTVGWWAVDTLNKDASGREIYQWDDYGAGEKLSTIVDFFSVHMYGFDRQWFGRYPDPYLYTSIFLADVKNALQTKKPLLIEEFGAANGEAVSDQEMLGSPQLQANVYGGVYQAIRDMNDPQILGTVAYQYNSRVAGPDAWALIKNRGDYVFAASYVLQKFATGTSDIALSLPLTPVPDDYLVSNAENGQTVIVHVNDVVGLSLTLDPSYNYAVSNSDDSIIYPSESLTHDWTRLKYDAVFHAAHPGSAVLTINQSQGCQGAGACGSNIQKVFSVTVAVSY